MVGISVQDKDEFVYDSVDDKEATLTEEEVRTLLQDTSIDDEGDDDE